ncbi:MAG TPA: histidine kinase [Flavisolibacter sp.]|nr:histidine kinase [Flavisolibacter sp.]
MQLFIPASAARGREKIRWWAGLRRLAFIRTAIGFTIGEAIVWFGFVVMWPTILGGVYFFGGLFEAGKAMPPGKFIVTSVVVVVTKALVTVPIWWLFFNKLKEWPVWKRALLHLPVGCVYAIISTFIIYQVKIHFLESLPPTNLVRIGNWNNAKAVVADPYPWSVVLLDTYNMLSAYFMNFILFHAYNFWLSSQRQQKREQELRELAFQSEINALKTQIEPHFLFNTLNSISATVPPTLENTRVLIAQLADTFRYALRVSESQFVLLGEELEFLKTWLALEQHRFGKRLRVYFDIDPNALSTTIPPMLLQPLVENALNHGIAHRVEGGSVTIQCLVTNAETVSISVRDTGVGYAGDLNQIMNKGIGLSNIAKRLHLLYNQPVRVERLSQGLSFSFHLPKTRS